MVDAISFLVLPLAELFNLDLDFSEDLPCLWSILEFIPCLDHSGCQPQRAELIELYIVLVLKTRLTTQKMSILKKEFLFKVSPEWLFSIYYRRIIII